MISSTVFVRVVPQDRDRGYMLLVGYDNKVVQRTAAEFITLNNVTRASLNSVIEMIRKSYRASEIKDVTAPGITKKLQALFGETPEKTEKPKAE